MAKSSKSVRVSAMTQKMDVDAILQKSENHEFINGEEIAFLFSLSPFSRESALVRAMSYQKSQECNQGWAEVHAQVGLNISPCSKNCLFCAFAAKNQVFKERVKLSVEEAVQMTSQFERDGANAIFLMATADFDFCEFLETTTEIKRNLRKDTVLVANVGDFSLEEAKKLKDVGFSGVYHAVRLGEEKITRIPVKRRLETFLNAKEVGLSLGTCVEPVGPEHTVEELVEKTLITREAAPVYSGAARRIPIPNTELARHGIVSEARMAHILAVVRVALPKSIPGNCTHEPNVVGVASGSNLLWAEVGSNPRDPEKQTERARGLDVGTCRKMFEEAEVNVLNGPSLMYQSPSSN